jgi:CheY-like chemotaxis protein
VIVLIVDDDAVARILLRHLVTRKGLDAIEAEDGDEALEVLAGERVDLIVSDQNMPTMSGLELRSILGADCTVPFVLLTGHAERGELADLPGFDLVDAFLTKPVASSQFDELLDRYAPER